MWLECDGENPADKENLGEVTYYPTNGVSASFYPYTNQRGYLSPVIFAKLDNPKREFQTCNSKNCLYLLSSADGVMIAIECKAWAMNIEHDSMERRGLAHFELMID